MMEGRLDHEWPERGRKARKGVVHFVGFRSFRDPKHRRAEIGAPAYGLYGLADEGRTTMEGHLDHE